MACRGSNRVIKVTSDRKVFVFAKKLQTLTGLTFNREENSPVIRLKGSEVVNITSSGKWIPLRKGLWSPKGLYRVKLENTHQFKGCGAKALINKFEFTCKSIYRKALEKL